MPLQINKKTPPRMVDPRARMPLKDTDVFYEIPGRRADRAAPRTLPSGLGIIGIGGSRSSRLAATAPGAFLAVDRRRQGWRRLGKLAQLLHVVRERAAAPGISQAITV